ncbi:MAG: CHAD domain-containing protein [Candidatus Wenzhouxiangella sp. M2_3B_020]
MSYRLERDESIEDGIRRIAVEQIDKALAEIDDDDLDRHETVHQVRKRCKKLRALARLVRPVFPGYKRINATYRDAAKELSWIRDAHAVIETIDDLVDRFDDATDSEAFRPIREELVARRDETDADRETIDRRIEQFRDTMAGGRAEVASWTLEADGGPAVAGGTKKTFKRARNAMAEAADAPTTGAFHEWRKRVKYHWYHARLLKACWPKLVKPWANEAHRLSDLLGDEHDLAVLHATLLESPERFADRDTLQAFTGLVERRRAELRTEAFALGTLLLFEKPKELEKRAETWVDAWRQPPRSLSALPPQDVER